MNDKYVDFSHVEEPVKFNCGMEDLENHGMQYSEKEQSIRNCLLSSENIMVEMLKKICGKSDVVSYAEFAHMFEAWKEDKENL